MFPFRAWLTPGQPQAKQPQHLQEPPAPKPQVLFKHCNGVLITNRTFFLIRKKPGCRSANKLYCLKLGVLSSTSETGGGKKKIPACFQSHSLSPVSHRFDPAWWDGSHLITMGVWHFASRSSTSSRALKINPAKLLRLYFPTKFPAEPIQPSFHHMDRPPWL